MTEEDELLATIAAHPEEDMPRLVYADWLEEHHDSIRAEFIRVQCDIARKQATLPRAELDQHVHLFRRDHELRENYREELLGSLATVKGSDVIEFYRGFPSEIFLDVDVFLAHAETIAAARPPLATHVTGVAHGLAQFLRSPFLSCVTEIVGRSDTRIATDPPSSAMDQVALAADRLIRLESLDLGFCSIGGALLPSFGPAAFAALVELDLSNNELTDEAITYLLQTNLPSRLKRLVLEFNPITDAGAIALADGWPRQNQLRHINLRGAPIGSIGHQALLARFGGKIDLF